MSKPNKSESALAERVEAMQADIEEFIAARVLELKNSQDGRTQPIGSLRMMLTARDRCPCQTALRLSKL